VVAVVVADKQEFDFMKLFRTWLPLAVAVIALSGLVYVSVQQDLRMGANDPQIQIAEDGATAIAAGTTSKAFVATFPTIDMGKSLAPFVIVVDDSGEVAYSSATLNGTTPVPPQGVLDYAKQYGENRLTWEPAPNVRIAAVVTRIDSEKHAGWVIAGRSLREVEVREDQLMKQIETALIITLIGTLIAAWVVQQG